MCPLLPARFAHHHLPPPAPLRSSRTLACWNLFTGSPPDAQLQTASPLALARSSCRLHPISALAPAPPKRAAPARSRRRHTVGHEPRRRDRWARQRDTPTLLLPVGPISAASSMACHCRRRHHAQPHAARPVAGSTMGSRPASLPQPLVDFDLCSILTQPAGGLRLSVGVWFGKAV